MPKADMEMRLKCLDLAMRSSTYKIDSALVTAERLVEFVERDTTPAAPDSPPAEEETSGQPRKRPRKTAGETAAEGG